MRVILIIVIFKRCARLKCQIIKLRGVYDRLFLYLQQIRFLTCNSHGLATGRVEQIYFVLLCMSGILASYLGDIDRYVYTVDVF
ncbi:hypothetical protein Nit79A3_3167 [Nitrosomonas sp. Is79A3]